MSPNTKPGDCHIQYTIDYLQGTSKQCKTVNVILSGKLHVLLNKAECEDFTLMFFQSFGANSIATKPFEEYKQICFSNMMLNISPPILLVYLQSLLYNFQDLACS